jgi:hypothetical protein
LVEPIDCVIARRCGSRRPVVGSVVIRIGSDQINAPSGNRTSGAVARLDA